MHSNFSLSVYGLYEYCSLYRFSSRHKKGGVARERGGGVVSRVSWEFESRLELLNSVRCRFSSCWRHKSRPSMASGSMVVPPGHSLQLRACVCTRFLRHARSHACLGPPNSIHLDSQTHLRGRISANVAPAVSSRINNPELRLGLNY